MNKSDYLYTKAGNFFIPLIPRSAVPKDTVYRWGEEAGRFVEIGGEQSDYQSKGY